MAAMDAASGYDRMKELKEFDESKIGVKGLSDSGITSIPRFFVHPPEILSDLKSSSTCTSIPVIDLSAANSTTRRRKIVEQVKEAATTWGFFQVINHGVPVSALDETINAIKALHDEPHTLKRKYKYYKRDEGQGVMHTCTCTEPTLATHLRGTTHCRRGWVQGHLKWRKYQRFVGTRR